MSRSLRKQIIDSEPGTSSEEEIEEGLSSDSDQEDDVLPSPSKSPAKGKGKQKSNFTTQSSKILVQTSFDAYFTAHSQRSQTSANVFSNLVLPLTGEEYNTAIDNAQPRIKPLISTLMSDTDIKNALFQRFIIELQEGFNILCYGYGSKRLLLDEFASNWCSSEGHVIIGEAFQQDFTLKDLLSNIESNIPEIQEMFPGSTSNTPEKLAQRISDFFSNTHQHLYIIIHNIDSASLRTSKAKSTLSLLALTPNIHITASVDHINSGLIWTSSEATTRKPFLSSSSLSNPPQSPTLTPPREMPTPQLQPRGFSFLYHDLTTLQPYDYELSSSDHTILSGSHGGGPRKSTASSLLQSSLQPATTTLTAGAGAGGVGGINTAMTETAALHVLASVTLKARKLFLLLGERQLESIEELGGNTNVNANMELSNHGVDQGALMTLARTNFLATNDTALRALLGEFRDHGLVVSGAGSGGGEVLWIPIRKERLGTVVKGLKEQLNS